MTLGDSITAQPDGRALAGEENRADRRKAEKAINTALTVGVGGRLEIIRTRHSKKPGSRQLTADPFPSHLWLNGPGPRPLSPGSPVGQPAIDQTDLSSSHKRGGTWVLTHGETLGSPFLLWA